MSAPDPAVALQDAIYTTLTAADIGAPVMYLVKQGTPLPWCYIGDDHILSDYDSDYFSEAHATVHVYAVNKLAAKIIAGKVRTALDLHLTLDGFIVTEAWFEDARHMIDQDGQTGHSVLTFRYCIRPADE